MYSMLILLIIDRDRKIIAYFSLIMQGNVIIYPFSNIKGQYQSLFQLEVENTEYIYIWVYTNSLNMQNHDLTCTDSYKTDHSCTVRIKPTIHVQFI